MRNAIKSIDDITIGEVYFMSIGRNFEYWLVTDVIGGRVYADVFEIDENDDLRPTGERLDCPFKTFVEYYKEASR